MVEEGEDSEVFNIEIYPKYRDALVISFYLMPALAIMLQLACFKNRKVARLFYYVEMIWTFQLFCLPSQEYMVSRKMELIALSLLMNMGFYVDLKLNMLAQLVTYSLNYFWVRPSIKYAELESSYLVDSSAILIFTQLTLVISALFNSQSTVLNKRIRVQMQEYLGLLNRMHQGVIVLGNTDKTGDSDSTSQKIMFCSQEGLKILRPNSEV